MKYFTKELEHIERWSHLRPALFRNEEPRIKLVGMTMPTEEMASQGITTETLPAYTARQSHESEGTHEDDLRLNRKLISWGHHTCLEAVQFVFYVTGVSKSLAGQWTRHRIGIGWTFRSTRYVKANKNMFIYPALEYLDSEEKVESIYQAYDRSTGMPWKSTTNSRSSGCVTRSSGGSCPWGGPPLPTCMSMPVP